MNVSIISQVEIRDPARTVSAFPGAVMLPDGEILLMFTASSAFESSDSELRIARSRDGGDTWTLEGNPCNFQDLGFRHPFTACVKPVVLPDGSILAVGYGFLRDRPDLGLSDYAAQFGVFPEMRNLTLRSSDGGRRWSRPEWIDHSGGGLELSGPAIVCRDGKVRFFGSQLVVNPALLQGFAFESGDLGQTWSRSGVFFSSSDVSAWEVRAAELPSGRIVLAFWAFDLKKQRNLNNHLVWSDDGGKTWSPPADTGLRGQAANFLVWNNRLGLIQARREGDAPGIYVNRIDFAADGTVKTGPDCRIWDASGLANRTGRIEQQFAGLKFGQPSVLPLSADSALLFFWRCLDGIYSIQAWKIIIGDSAPTPAENRSSRDNGIFRKN